MTHIVIVEDEPDISEVVSLYLQRAGYTVTTFKDGFAAQDALTRQIPDLVILDIMLPGMDGYTLTSYLRERSNVPIILLTSRREEVDRIAGLELGADDYVVKPFSPREVVARVRAVLRRTTQVHRSGADSGAPARTVLQAGPIRLDMAKRTVTVDGEAKALTTAQFDILTALMLEPGRVFTRMQLLVRIQGSAFEGYERTIDVHIKNIRRALGDSSAEARFIGTVRGVGYRLLEG